MTALQIKHALENAGSSQADIARRTGKSPQLVGEVIRRTRHNAGIQLAIAQAIGKPIAEVFPAAEPAASP